jgi:hypothetical protein
MNWGSPAFVLAIIAMSFGAWIVTSWIRAKHGYPLENEWSGMTYPTDPERESKVATLTEENERLRAQLGRLEARLAVLERIATDPAERTAREIEKLR